jgi:hypothetical protein
MVVVAGQGRFVSNFALTHFNAAKHFSTKVGQIESASRGQASGNFWEEISIYCASCIVSAAASLEALINELFLAPGPLRTSITDFDTFFWGGYERRRCFLLFKCSKRIRGLEREPALRKYEKALSLLNKPALSRTDASYRHAEALIGFRNYLIHFKPLWDDERRHQRLEDQLQGLFQTSPCADLDADFLAEKCMSAGCSDWAVQTVTNFVQDFAQKSRLDPQKLGAFRV